MLIFRSLNNFAFAYFGPLFFLIPILLYGILKFKTRQSQLPVGVASFEKRAFAILFDIGILYAIEIGMLQTIALSNNPSFLPVPLVVITVAIINMIILPGITGWSLGKRLFGLKILKKSYDKAGFFDIFYREIIKSWFSLPFIYLGCFWMLIGKNQLTWHDSVADTRVFMISYIDERLAQEQDIEMTQDTPFKL